MLGPDSELSFLSLQTTESGSSIYKVQAVDKDTGSGGSVTYYLQVQKDGHTQRHINVDLNVRQEQLVWSDSGGEVANIWTQQLSPSGTVIEHMGSLHPDGHQDGLKKMYGLNQFYRAFSFIHLSICCACE